MQISQIQEKIGFLASRNEVMKLRDGMSQMHETVVTLEKDQRNLMQRADNNSVLGNLRGPDGVLVSAHR